MKRTLLILFVAALLGGSGMAAFRGYRNYRILQVSDIPSEHEIHLERVGSYSFTAPLQGRSLFRPGGVVEIFIPKLGNDSKGDMAGKATVTIRNGQGKTCLETSLEGVNPGWSSRGRFLSLQQEFDTASGGPYQIQFDVTEPFTALVNLPQTLSVHHFVCGNEAIIHFIQFGLAGLLALGSLVPVWFLVRRKKQQVP